MGVDIGPTGAAAGIGPGQHGAAAAAARAEVDRLQTELAELNAKYNELVQQEQVKLARSQTLERYIGRRFPVLIEGRQDAATGTWTGYTPNFLKVAITGRAPGQLENRIREVRLQGLAENGERLTGLLV